MLQCNSNIVLLLYCCAGGAVFCTLYSHVEVLRSIPDQGEIYVESSVSAAHPAHSAVMSRPGLHYVKGKVARPSPS